MSLEDISAVMKLCDDNVQKLQDNLTSYQREVNHVHQVLAKRWINVEKVDGRLIALHDQVLSSLSEINAHVIKMNLHLKLNRPGLGMIREGEEPDELSSVKLSSRNAIEDGGKEHKMNEASVQQAPEDSGHQLVPIDLPSTPKFAIEETPPKPSQFSESLVFSMHSSWVIEPAPKNLKPKPKQQVSQATKAASPEKPKPKSTPVEQIFQATKAASPEKLQMKSIPVEQVPQATKAPSPEKPKPKQQVPQATTGPQLPSPWFHLVKFPMPARNRTLLPPKSGSQTSSEGIYEQIFKNIDAFSANTVVTATVMHLNIAKNCIYVAKWDAGSRPLQQLLQGQVPLRELDEMPDYGDIFAVYDCSDQIITRATVNTMAEVGGYDAYLLDYGEHIHLSGNEHIFAMPEQIKRLPAEAIRCHLANYDVSSMNKYSYKTVKLHVLHNNGVDIVADLLEEEASVKGQRQIAPKPEMPKDKPKLSEAAMDMLNEIGESTSDPLKAVLGFRPRDEQRICRHYDPKIKGCFKGNTCGLIHEPFAPLGATKDVEVTPALPEAVFDTPVHLKLGNMARMLITFVNSPIEVYAQIVDGDVAPLVWDNEDVPENKRTFKQKPHILDIVLARYSDNCFYRAQVVDELDGVYKIFYVDYGNTEFVLINSLAPCDDVDSLKPHRAISCHMEGVIRAPELTHQKTAECVEYLKAQLLNVELDVVIRHRLPDGFLVRFTGEYADVPRQLVIRGYAQPSEGLQGVSNGVVPADNGPQVEF